VGRVDEQSTAYTNRDAAYSLVISSGWDDPDETDTHVAWVRTFWNAIQPFSTGGAYINFMSHDEGRDRVIAAYGQEVGWPHLEGHVSIAAASETVRFGGRFRVWPTEGPAAILVVQ
jgi:hypothetical protein